MPGSYSPLLVAVSLAVAVLASYTTLNVAERIRSIAVSAEKRRYWRLGGAAAMGTGIWSMHFIGMLAMQMPMEIGYDPALTALSLVIAVGVSWFALLTVTGSELTHRRLAVGGSLMGLGVAAMHYTGMAAMRMSPRLHYRTGLFLISVGVAIVASWAALWIAFTLRGDGRSARWMRGMASVAMGAAIAGMHYTGMAAAVMPAHAICSSLDGVSAGWLAFAVTGSSLCVLAVTLVISILDTQFDRQSLQLNTTLNEVNRQLLTMATEDTLTGLPNRNSYMQRAEKAVACSRETGRPFAVMFMDLDGFKGINDSLGHSAGDKLLKSFAESLTRLVRRGDMVARLGGDEFVLLVEGVAGMTELEIIAGSILERMQKEFVVDESLLRVTTSIGIAAFPAHAESVEGLLQCADLAMYEAKQSGRNTFRFYDAKMRAAAARTLQIRHGIAAALRRNELFMVFQPKFAGIGRNLAGAEALIRWTHPEMGLIPPAEFIPIAEQTQQIGEICDWVIANVCRQMRLWDAEGLEPVRIAINLSAEQMRQPGLVGRLRLGVEGAGVRSDRIMFEITETVAMRDPDLTAKIIEEFQSAGFDVAIDDFGTGYSSMAYLQQFRVRQLKIDRFFTNGLDSHGEEGLAIVAAIIELAHSLQMVVVAEGVETETQLEKLDQLRCDEVQGFLLARPLSSVDFVEFMRQRRTTARSALEKTESATVIAECAPVPV